MVYEFTWSVELKKYYFDLYPEFLSCIFNLWFLSDYWELLDKTYVYLFLIKLSF